MQKRTLGKSGLNVSAIGAGCWPIGGSDWNLNMEMGWSGTNDQQSLAGLFRAFDLGVTYFDTADVYGHGHSERLIGEFLKEVGRSNVVIADKVGYFRGCAPYAYHPLHMRHQLEMSLNNLGTDYIDIYSFHHLSFGENNRYLDAAFETMLRFKEEGKIRCIGQRGPHRYAPTRIEGAGTSEDKYTHFLDLAKQINPSVIQLRYNMISPAFDSPEKDLFAWAEFHDIGIVINKPLGQGLLLNKYDPDNPPIFGPGDHRRRKVWFRSEALALLRKRLTHIEARFGTTLSDLISVALQYCLARSENACVVVGFKTPDQIAMSLAATERTLSQEDIHYIRAAMSGIQEEIGLFFASEKREGYA